MSKPRSRRNPGAKEAKAQGELTRLLLSDPRSVASRARVLREEIDSGKQTCAFVRSDLARLRRILGPQMRREEEEAEARRRQDLEAEAARRDRREAVATILFLLFMVLALVGALASTLL